MPEPDENTGEVYQSEAEKTVVAMMTPQQLINYEPPTPEFMEELLFHLGIRVERAPAVIAELYENVHRKTEKYELAFSDATLEHGGQISFARAFAKKKTAPLLNELNVAKEALRYAEELQKALVAKYFGYMNINKSVTASFMGSQSVRFR